MKSRIYSFSLFCIWISIILLDQYTKWIFEKWIFLWSNHPECIDTTHNLIQCHTLTQYKILGDWLGFERMYNVWIAFSLPIHGGILKILTVFLVVFLVMYYLKIEQKKKSKLLDLGYIFLLWWALSHAYERIFYWYVVDFIRVKYFAVFNIADIFISIGAMCIIYYYFSYDKSK